MLSIAARSWPSLCRPEAGPAAGRCRGTRPPGLAEVQGLPGGVAGAAGGLAGAGTVRRPRWAPEGRPPPSPAGLGAARRRLHEVPALEPLARGKGRCFSALGGDGGQLVLLAVDRDRPGHEAHQRAPRNRCCLDVLRRQGQRFDSELDGRPLWIHADGNALAGLVGQKGELLPAPPVVGVFNHRLDEARLPVPLLAVEVERRGRRPRHGLLEDVGHAVPSLGQARVRLERLLECGLLGVGLARVGAPADGRPSWGELGVEGSRLGEALLVVHAVRDRRSPSPVADVQAEAVVGASVLR
mmetsp:Transcript_61614/g.178742  ORF Transcript_61614/g.178742 Transcript_61614/m.178742 type:complete len:298 (+) Transcript_61614:78-971(+)